MFDLFFNILKQKITSYFYFKSVKIKNLRYSSSLVEIINT